MSALFRSSRTSEALRELEQMYDLILIGGPPWLESAGSTALGQVVDGVVVIVERGTSKESMENTRRQLAFLVSDTLGFVFIHDD
jgi:Mrp family chromosome partitioning ATPase